MFGFSLPLQPRVQWMKNQMIIGEDPKFRQICVQGICSLEIRRPGNFDGGVYSCKAINDHGEATVSCKLEVKRECVKRPKATFLLRSQIQNVSISNVTHFLFLPQSQQSRSQRRNRWILIS